MQKKKTVAGVLAAAMTVVLSVLRIALAPALTTNDGGVWSIVLFLLLPVSVAVLLSIGPKSAANALPVGRSMVSFSAIFTGVLFLFSAVWVFFRWKNLGEWPFPAPSSPSTLATALLLLSCTFALLGGVFFVAQGISWLCGKPFTNWLPLFSLAPLVWMWVRICQYETSYYSSLSVVRHWYDLAALLVEMILFLQLARTIVLPDKPPRNVFGIFLSAGMLLTAACVTRIVMALAGNETALENSGLLTAPDLGVALLAFALAKAYVPHEDLPAEDSPAAAEAEDESETPLLLVPLAPEPLPDEDDAEETTESIETADSPLDLEEMILRIIENPEDEEN